MGKARNLSTLLDAGGDVKVANLDNVPASNNASALTTGTLPDGRFPSTLPAISGVNLTNITDQNFTNADHSKLDAIEASATADQTAAQIKAAYEGNNNTNVHTDAQVTKLSGIETSATADQTAAQIKTKYETNSNTNAFNDAAVTKLANIETSATADQTGAQIKTLYQAETNAFTDTKNTKLSGIETSATADQTNAEIKAAVEAASDSNTFTDADHSKLNAVEALADVTDTANVVAALTAGTNIAIAANGTVASTNTTYTAGTGLVLSGTTFSAGPIALTTVQTASSQSAQLALTAEAGDVVVRSDENKTYMHNGGSAGNMNDYTLLATPTDAVLSVNGVTGAITAAHIAAAVEAASNSHTFNDADHTKLNSVASSANNYVHPNHSGEVTSSADGATVIADNIVDEANLKVSNSPVNGKFLSAQSGASGGLTWATVDALPSQSGNSGKFLTTDATNASWAVLDTDANTTTKGLYEMANTIASNYSITSGNNALTAGPITINTGVTVTIPTGSTWVIA